MREIKFRGKRKDNGEWVEGYLVCHFGYPFILPTGYPAMSGDFYVHEWWDVDPATVGQYTGLRDKNGREIYEGDIIRHMSINSKALYVVEWDDGGAAFHYIPTDGIGGGYRLFRTSEGYFPYEVVGNIYYNPELLEGVTNHAAAT